MKDYHYLSNCLTVPGLRNFNYLSHSVNYTLITAPYPVYHRGRSCRSRDQGQSAEWRGHAVVHWPPPAPTARNRSCSECCLHGILWTDPAKEKTGRIKINSTVPVTSIKFSSEFVAA